MFYSTKIRFVLNEGEKDGTCVISELLKPHFFPHEKTPSHQNLDHLFSEDKATVKRQVALDLHVGPLLGILSLLTPAASSGKKRNIISTPRTDYDGSQNKKYPLSKNELDLM